MYSIAELQSVHHDIRKYLLVFHALTGCDTTSGIFRHTKASSLYLVRKNADYLNVFKEPNSSHVVIAEAGEMFFLQMYKATSAVRSLNELRYVMYVKRLKSQALNADLKLDSLPPTSAAAALHSYRAYHTVQVRLKTPIIHLPTKT